jgi:hypothetical protein
MLEDEAYLSLADGLIGSVLAMEVYGALISRLEPRDDPQ